jgi:hypothetical protein
MKCEVAFLLVVSLYEIYINVYSVISNEARIYSCFTPRNKLL